jgi:guanosine-diphosphatase
LHTGYEMPIDREVKIAKKIKGNELGWCLGARYVSVLLSELRKGAICDMRMLIFSQSSPTQPGIRMAVQDQGDLMNRLTSLCLSPSHTSQFGYLQSIYVEAHTSYHA